MMYYLTIVVIQRKLDREWKIKLLLLDLTEKWCILFSSDLTWCLLHYLVFSSSARLNGQFSDFFCRFFMDMNKRRRNWMLLELYWSSLVNNAFSAHFLQVNLCETLWLVDKTFEKSISSCKVEKFLEKTWN